MTCSGDDAYTLAQEVIKRHPSSVPLAKETSGWMDWGAGGGGGGAEEEEYV